MLSVKLSPVALFAFAAAGWTRPIHGFVPRRFSANTLIPSSSKCSSCPGRIIQPMMYMSNQFDISRPVFDIFAFRSVRGDAIVRYNALNQSEPLRIILYALLTLSFLAAPSLSEAVGYDKMGLPLTIASTLAGATSAYLFIRECSLRSKQLIRIEKELNTELLTVRLPANVLSDTPFSKPKPLKELRNLPNAPRFIAINGTKQKLREALKGLSILGRRLKQASVYVVPLATDGSKPSDWQLLSEYPPWIADPYDKTMWQDYFDGLSAKDASNPTFRPSFRWFGLTASGRSFGSGDDEIPQWLQILGQHLRPTQVLDTSDPVFATYDSTFVV